MDFFERACQFRDRGQPFSVAMVVRAEKPTSAKPGDKALIDADGQIFGWIGGACARDTVISEARNALNDGNCRLVRISTSPDDQVGDGRTDVLMTCYSGGLLEIYIEPQLPASRLLVIGDTPVAEAVAALGTVLEFDIAKIAAEPGSNPNEWKGQILASVRNDTHVIVATGGHHDEIVLVEVAKTTPRYVGIVASKKRFAAVRDYLRLEGIADEMIAGFKAPAGIDILAKRPAEIALSILAEVVQRRAAATLAVGEIPTEAAKTAPIETDAKATNEVVSVGSAKGCCGGAGKTVAENLSEPPPGVAIDPICRMSVNTATAAHKYQYKQNTYYFCCGRCKTAFQSAPEKYIINIAE